MREKNKRGDRVTAQTSVIPMKYRNSRLRPIQKDQLELRSYKRTRQTSVDLKICAKPPMERWTSVTPTWCRCLLQVTQASRQCQRWALQLKLINLGKSRLLRRARKVPQKLPPPWPHHPRNISKQLQIKRTIQTFVTSVQVKEAISNSLATELS